MKNKFDIIIYQTENGDTKLEVRLENSTCKDFLQVQKEGNREVKREQKFYNKKRKNKFVEIIAAGYNLIYKVKKGDI